MAWSPPARQRRSWLVKQAGDYATQISHHTRDGTFIQPEDGGKDVFVHITAVQAAGLNGLNDGQKVSYEVVRERGKEAAANLKLG
jgi:cold shock protein